MSRWYREGKCSSLVDTEGNEDSGEEEQKDLHCKLALS
jgi:hypothetical protein